MKRTKLLALALAGVMTLALLTGCSGGKSEDRRIAENVADIMKRSHPNVEEVSYSVPELSGAVRSAFAPGWLNEAGTVLDRYAPTQDGTVVNMKALGEYTVTVDCDVIQADGGTRTASITGAWVALHDALAMWVEAGKIERIPLTGQVAAISMGVVDGNTLLDLDYSEDSHAEVDMNLVATDTGEMIELQGTGEQAPFDRKRLNALLDLGDKGIAELIELQRQAIA